MRKAYVIGSGPNGLTAAILLAKAGFHTTVLEAQASIGGGMRSAELTLPGFVHDLCSAVHPFGIGSPVFSSFPLAEHGLEWIHSPSPLAHVLDDASAVLLERSIERTVENLGVDGAAYRRVVEPLVARWSDLLPELLSPLHIPSHPLLLARFGLNALPSAVRNARALFRTPHARALFAGLAAHSIMPLENTASASFGWVLALAAHAVGWPIPKGGSQRIADAMAAYFQTLGGEIAVNTTVKSVDELKEAEMILCDVGPRQLVQLAGHRLPEGYSRKLSAYRYGPGVYKMDWALSGPIPWKAKECSRAATVHLGGTLENIAASERAPWEGRTAERPFILLAQPSLFDSTRAPTGKHTAWAYCHVPNGWTGDMSGRIESEIERAAPGFCGLILAKHGMTPAILEAHNANLIGGDITGGEQTLRQLFLRPTRQLYRTPVKGLYLCSASTPPGGGVHGMCGYHAARAALADAGVS